MISGSYASLQVPSNINSLPQMIQSICICGAGTMGSGIAQVCAQNGLHTLLFDLNETVLENASGNITANLEYLAGKNKITPGQKEQTLRQIQYSKNISNCTADIIIEAIIEKTEAKVELFNQLAEYNSPQVIFATNTSSLSVTSIQEKIKHPSRVVGMHFFNPAPLMKLVEVIKGEHTSEVVTKTIYDLCIRLGKVPVVCKDAPGFIVNRVARHYYLEAMRLVEDGVATFENVDTIMEATGFRMGPFKLMDLIGMDINLSVSQSLYDAFNKEQRFKPSALQIEKVRDGQLGKKTGQGFYDYNGLSRDHKSIPEQK